MLKLLDGLVWDHQVYRRTHKLIPELHPDHIDNVWRIDHPDYGLEVIETRPEDFPDEETGETVKRSVVEFVVTSGMMVDAFDKYCKNRGIRNPFKEAAIFGARLKNDLPMLQKSGWELVTKTGSESHFKKVRGANYYKFRKLVFNPTS